MHNTRWLLMAAVLLLVGIAAHMVVAEEAEQGAPTATPAQVDLFNAVPAAEQFGDTPTPTRTATPIGPVQVEALEAANVRGDPDPEGALLGQIRPGEFYNVIRQYYRWIEIQFDAAPNRRGWVFEDLVRVIGDAGAIAQVESLSATVEGAPDLNSTSTQAALTQTPGGLLTATAIARTNPVPALAVQQFDIDAPDSSAPVELTEEAISAALPTFTYPPGIIALAPTEPAAQPDIPTEAVSRAARPTDGGIPPLLPIAVLGGLGLLGLMISSVRR